MWRYIKRYLPCAVLAALLMAGEVSMDLIQPGIMCRIVDEGALGLETGGVGDLGLIGALGLRMIVLVLFGGLCGSLNNVFTHYSSQSIGNEMRKDAFRRIMSFSFPQLDRFGTGSLVTRVPNDITQVQNFVSLFMRGLIRTGILTFGSMYCMFRLSRNFGLIVLCAFPLVTGCIALCLWKANDALVGTQLRVLVIFAFMNPAVNAMMYGVVAAILYAGATQAAAGGATPGDVMAAVTYTTQLLNGVLMLVMLFQNISRGLASWKRVKELMDSEPELKDGSFDGATGRQGEIQFRDVSFTYPGMSRPVLEHINLTIHPGETVAVMGATGCGKTSLVNLIPRFYDVTAGAVLVDGVDVREYRQQTLREKVAFALQKAELFTVSIQENIALGRPEAVNEELVSAAETTQADSFIRSAPDGYNTMVAERGMSLSGGQKQRLPIARAVSKRAEILILDDATSALDLKTEAELYRALGEKHPGVTKLIVAQRAASVRLAACAAQLCHRPSDSGRNKIPRWEGAQVLLAAADSPGQAERHRGGDGVRLSHRGRL